MHPVQVLPIGPQLTTATHVVTGLYTVQASHELPRIDATRTLKSVWLSRRVLRWYNSALHRSARGLTLLNIVGNFFLGTISFYPAAVGRWVALVVTPLMFPPFVAMLFGMRYDMVVVLLQTFDFWYQLMTSTLCAILFTASFDDVRSIAGPSVITMFVIVLLADASCRGQRSFFVVSVCASLLCVGLSCVVAFGWVDDMHPFVILRVHGHALTTSSVITHGYAIITIVNMHNAYVRRQFVTAKRRTTSSGSTLTTTVRCVLYRCRLRWHDRATSTRLAVQLRPTKSSFDEKCVQLRCLGLLQVIDARRTLLRHCGSYKDKASQRTCWKQWIHRTELILSGFIGFYAIYGVFIATAVGYDRQSMLVQTLSTLSFVLTVRVWLYFVCCVHQCEMMQLLHTNFDFLFVFVQLLLAQVCLCDLCDWDARVGAIVASVLWIHWALTVDAISPIARDQLRLPTHRIALIIEFMFVCLIVVIAFDLIVWNLQNFQDRPLLKRLGHHTTSDLRHWSVGSFFLNRLVTLIAWICRSLWRLATYDVNELVVLRGAVEYDDYELHKRVARSSMNQAQLQQIVSALSQQSHREGSEVVD